MPPSHADDTGCKCNGARNRDLLVIMFQASGAVFLAVPVHFAQAVATCSVVT